MPINSVKKEKSKTNPSTMLRVGGEQSRTTNPSIKLRIALSQSKRKNWSDYVTKHSFALDLEEGVFTWDDPRKIAESLKKSAEESLHRKGTPFQSAMSMLNF